MNCIPRRWGFWALALWQQWEELWWQLLPSSSNFVSAEVFPSWSFLLCFRLWVGYVQVNCLKLWVLTRMMRFRKLGGSSWTERKSMLWLGRNLATGQLKKERHRWGNNFSATHHKLTDFLLFFSLPIYLSLIYTPSKTTSLQYYKCTNPYHNTVHTSKNQNNKNRVRRSSSTWSRK